MKNVIVFLVGVVTFVTAHPTRIVNGTDAEISDYPYIVSLRYYTQHMCGASIINDRFILTAAHCFYQVKDHFTIQYGYTHISESYDQSIDVTEIHEHADFQMIRPFPNDVAVLKLASAIPFGGNAQPIVLPRQYESAPVNGVSTLVGWGYLVTGGQVSTTLQMVNLKIYIHEECEAAHPTVEWEYNLCSGVDEGWKGQCSGDSGGPLTADGKQVGIVSWSEKPCGKKGYPGIYTRVSSYVDWINGKISA